MPPDLDVVVVGSGAAGLCAALASARLGARTLLVEYHGFLGGLSSTLPWLGFHDRDYRLVAKGLPLEVARRLQREGSAADFALDPKCGSALSLDGHHWKCVAMSMAREAGVRLMLQAQVVDAVREGDRIAGIVTESKSGRRTLRARTVIDCSGDGDVAARAGAAFEKGRPADGLVQAPTLVFRLGGVDREAFLAGCKDRSLRYREWIADDDALWEKMMKRIDRLPAIVCGGFAGLVEKARAAGDLDVPQTRVVGVKLHRPDQFLAVMTRVLGLDPTDADSLSEAAARVHAQVPRLVAFFRKYVPGFARAHLLEVAPMLGVRESRRVLGDHALSAEDLVAGRRFDDAVCMGGYHVDIHRPAGTWVESRNVPAYTIPLRCLVPRGLEGLMMAGKCLSATHEALASTRVVPCCMAQGEAAGTAAALAARRGCAVRDLPFPSLRDQLRAQGAEFGETLGEPDLRAIEEVGQLPLDEPPTTGDRDRTSSAAAAWLR
jgi:glycine/D-amino acid oxidase-like deaminating enzyme